MLFFRNNKIYSNNKLKREWRRAAGDTLSAAGSGEEIERLWGSVGGERRRRDGGGGGEWRQRRGHGGESGGVGAEEWRRPRRRRRRRSRRGEGAARADGVEGSLIDGVVFVGGARVLLLCVSVCGSGRDDEA